MREEKEADSRKEKRRNELKEDFGLFYTLPSSMCQVYALYIQYTYTYIINVVNYKNLEYS